MKHQDHTDWMEAEDIEIARFIQRLEKAGIMVDPSSAWAIKEILEAERVEQSPDAAVKSAAKAPDLKPGWYWVLFERSDDTRTAPTPAQWDGRHWVSVGWSGIPLHRAQVIGPIEPPGEDPLQGAADWLCRAFDEPDVALIQKRLSLGYNRSARLFEKAIARKT